MLANGGVDSFGMIGSQLGPYRLLRLLGAGGMGQVYLGEHVVLGRYAAIKVLDARLVQHEQLVARFVNEARAAAKLQHPNLIPIYDIAQAPNGPWYMALEYLQGETLGHYLASAHGPASPAMIVRALAPVASCMTHVHARGAIHRDLKPDNIFLIERGKNPHYVIVLDLGVAQLSEELAKSPGTKSGTIIGTPVYMAPEQLLGRRVSPAADVYAIGVIAYEMATGGWFPFQRDDETRTQYIELAESEISFRQRTTAPIDPRRRFAGIPDRFVEALMPALERDPARRPASAAAYALGLAGATAANDAEPDGLEIVRQVAEDLLQSAERSPSHGQRPPAEIASASKADAKYQILDKLGAGGMAEVFLARHLGEAGFEKTVAIKRVLAGFSKMPDFATMFVSEARLASRLAHENIVSVSDFSKDAEGRLFLVMEYVHGRDLATLLDAGPIGPSLVIYILVEMLRGLGYAHELPDPSGASRGLVHRDVSPQNVLLSYEGGVKLSDFGLAKAMSASGRARSETPRGKVSYMSPEQCNGDALDGRSDLFATGVLLWEMLTNTALFSGTPFECIAQIMFKQIPAPHSIRSRIPPDLEGIAMRLLARDLGERYLTAEAVIADLLACADAPRDGRGELARVLAERFPDATARQRSTDAKRGTPRGLVAQQITIPAPPSTAGGAAPQSVPRGRTRARVLAVVAAGVAALAVVIAFGLARHRAAATTRDAGALGEQRANDAGSMVAVASTSTRSPADAGAPIAVDATIDAAPSTVATRRPVAPPDAGTHVVASSHSSRAAPPSAPPHESTGPVALQGAGELAVFVHPWAEVWLDSKDVGQTPFRERAVPAGRHKLRVVNEDLGKDESMAITVTPDQTTTIERSW